MIDSAPRWFTAIPIPYADDPGFWFRDMGSMCLWFRQQGMDSRLVALGTPGARENPPVVLGSLEQLAEARWWRQWNLTGVVLTSWAAPRFEPIARAIKESGARLVVRLDSDGTKSPRVNFWRFLYNMYFEEWNCCPWQAAPRALAKAVLFRLAPGLYDRKVCAHLDHADLILIESPLARRALVRWLVGMGWGHLEPRIVHLPNAAQAQVVYEPGQPKQSQIVAVGRWDAVQKDAPRLMATLGRVLPLHSEYRAVLIGGGEARLARLRARLPTALHQRIQILGQIGNEAVHQHYLASQIILFSSRYEGFPYAAAEALCCGCTVVGPARLTSLNYLCCDGGGTLAITRSAQDLADAVGAEIQAWQGGRRDPLKISRYWREHLSVEAVGSAILKRFAGA
jgi:glycosyltransferase involved in cell wall biosynthesis